MAAKRSAWLLFPLLSISFVSLVVVVVVVRFSGQWAARPMQFPGAAGLDDPSPPAPRIAYFISGSDGDGHRILRLLRAVYHPRNQYLLHLDLRASHRQREDLVSAVRSVDSFVASGNVNVVGKADYANREGSTAIASVLHGAAVLLKHSKAWDWFVNLAASDYPLITQDDLLHVLSFLPRDINFIQCSDKIGWKESRRIRSIVVDPGIYLAAKRDIFIGTQKRPIPTSYRFATGSPFVILSRKFVQFAILGWDNLPRTLLMYFSNMRSPQRGYFHTLAINSKEFCDTVVASDLRFGSGAAAEEELPSPADLGAMLGSGAAFAGGFRPRDSLLDRIDAAALRRRWGRVTPGGWCVGDGGWWSDPCSAWGDADVLRPGPGARRFEKFLVRLMGNTSVWTSPCGPL
ncbi:unnamed protein product [Spirodela intermedia]|uniref:Uncharacterized protein n=1 Tax=Spirodela intermedia TaxID=51605 RepID=A0A7I8K5E1_SPIIN|nr:unnamed protein product [Spirodela intermedia]